jgi:hypothetical protein
MERLGGLGQLNNPRTSSEMQDPVINNELKRKLEEVVEA